MPGPKWGRASVTCWRRSAFGSFEVACSEPLRLQGSQRQSPEERGRGSCPANIGRCNAVALGGSLSEHLGA